MNKINRQVSEKYHIWNWQRINDKNIQRTLKNEQDSHFPRQKKKSEQAKDVST